MIDIDKANLTMIPSSHTMVGQSDQINRITGENKLLKIGLIIGFTIVILVIIRTSQKDDKKNKH